MEETAKAREREEATKETKGAGARGVKVRVDQGVEVLAGIFPLSLCVFPSFAFYF